MERIRNQLALTMAALIMIEIACVLALHAPNAAWALGGEQGGLPAQTRDEGGETATDAASRATTDASARDAASLLALDADGAKSAGLDAPVSGSAAIPSAIRADAAEAKTGDGDLPRTPASADERAASLAEGAAGTAEGATGATGAAGGAAGERDAAEGDANLQGDAPQGEADLPDDAALPESATHDPEALEPEAETANGAGPAAQPGLATAEQPNDSKREPVSIQQEKSPASTGSPDSARHPDADAAPASSSASGSDETSKPDDSAKSSGEGSGGPVESGKSTGTGKSGKSTGADKSTNSPEALPHVDYQVNVNGAWQPRQSDGDIAGTIAKKQHLGGVRLKVSGPVAGSIHYQVHAGILGWNPVTANGSHNMVAGGDVIDAVRIALSGTLSKSYNVKYRAYVQGLGWLGWVRNGKVAGKAGSGAAIQALRVKLVEKATPASTASPGIIGVRYRVNVAKNGWSPRQAANKVAGSNDKAARITNFQIKADTGAYSGSVIYRVHLTGGSWTGWNADGASFGTQKNIDAVQIRLAGKIAKHYDIVYRTRIKDVGWQRRLRNGEVGGWIDSGLPIGAVRIKLESKAKRSGWVYTGSAWKYLSKEKALTSSWLDTAESPVDLVITSKNRYWLDANGELAAERYILPSTRLDKKAGFAAYATHTGILFVGKRTADEGITLSNANGRLYATDCWVKSDLYDGEIQIYRMRKVGDIAVVRTGLFKTGGRKYYAWEDGRGYLMRSETRWIADRWYKASSSGALTNVNNKTSQHIERYVRWAIGIANDDAHGYSQYDRWGPDYDCSSLVCAALLAAGFPDSGALWTGNMLSCLTSIGFVWHEGTQGLRRGDIMLVHADYRQHTEIYLGRGELVGAHISELGTVYGEAGDQTGNEISVGDYYNAPWQGYLRYRG